MSVEASNEIPFALLNLDEKTSRPPDTRLKNGRDARRLLWSCLLEDQPRSMERALTKGLIDGNPPYDDAARRREGRGWEANLNLMEGLAIMDSSGIPYYALFAGVEEYAECRTGFQKDNPQYETWHPIISAKFTDLLKRWTGFNWAVQEVSYWMRLHGIGPAFFDKDGDWRFRALETSALLMPRGAASCIDKRLPFLIVRVPYRIMELYGYIKDEETARKAGWDVDAVHNAIKHGMKGLAPSGSNWYSQPWEYFERILKNNDLTASFTDSDLVYCSWILVQEFSGKISKFLFTEHEVPQTGPDVANKGEDNQFLFSDPNCYDDFQQALVAFFQNTGDGTYHSVRGLAMKAFKHLEVSNRLKCQAINRAFLDSSLIIQSASTRNSDKISLSVWGSVVRVPAGGEIKPITVQGGTQGVMEVDRMLTNHLANNIGMFNQRTLSREDGKGEVPTATQINQQVAKESTLSQGQITLFYQYLDALYAEMFRRAADSSTSDEEAKRFQDEVIEAGVPRGALKEMEYVRANRTSGYGSPQMGLLKQQQMMQILPMLPEQGKQNWLEDAVTLIEGPEKTKRYAPKTYIANEDDSIAALENGLIADGRAPVIASGQDDVVHLTSHFQDATDTLEPVSEAIQQDQKDPAQLQEAFKYVSTGAPHWEAHLTRLQNDPARQKEAKLFQEQFLHLVGFSGKLRAALKEAMREQQIAQEQQQQATALDAVTQAKVRAIDAGTAMDAAKTQSQIQNQTAKTVAGIQHKTVATAVDVGLKKDKTAAEIRIARNKANTTPNVLDSKLNK